jgi:hypothetical protein
MVLYARSDQPLYFRVKTVPGGDTPLSIAGAALKFVVRDKAGKLVASKTTAASQISIEDGVEDDGVTPTGGTSDMAVVDIDEADVDVTPGTEYAGALWRTDANTVNPLWEGPITVKVAPPR